jgi:hypothetical protein
MEFLNFVVNYLPHFILFLLIVLIYLIVRTRYNVLSHWHHTFDKTQFSTQDFYALVEAGVNEREIPNVPFSRKTHQEKVLLWRKREYLRVSRGEYLFDICVAPLGTGVYVSWWFIEQTTFLKRMLLKIPILAVLLTVRTFHQIDTELMYRDIIHTCVLEAIDKITEEHGVRLADPDRVIKDYQKLTS